MQTTLFADDCLSGPMLSGDRWSLTRSNGRVVCVPFQPQGLTPPIFYTSRVVVRPDQRLLANKVFGCLPQSLGTSRLYTDHGLHTHGSYQLTNTCRSIDLFSLQRTGTGQKSGICVGFSFSSRSAELKATEKKEHHESINK